MHRLMAVSSAMRARAAGRRLMSRRHLSAISMSESFLPLDTFVNRHCGSSPDEIQTMLDVVGVNHLEGLSEQCVPKDIYLQRLLKVPPAKGETEALAQLHRIMSRNQVLRSHIGCGYYGTVTPGVILRNILENPAWYTPYTPYQAEISQGRLEMLLNFQTMVCDLTGLPVANASLLDEGTAAAEAMLLAYNACNKQAHKLLVSPKLHPQTLAVIKTRAAPFGIEVIATKPSTWPRILERGSVFGAIVQYPSTDGVLKDWSEECDLVHKSGGLFVVASDLLALTVVKPPGEWGADVVVGSSQRFGVPMGYGGPHAAFFACRDELKRRAPGRIIGVSRDARGQRALRMAIQTREQHIRRDKATSNICTAQALLANVAAAYAMYHGPKGLRAIANRAMRAAQVARLGLEKLSYKCYGEFGSTFDTVTFGVSDAKAFAEVGIDHGFNCRIVSDRVASLSFDETVQLGDLQEIYKAIGKVKDTALDFTAADMAEVLEIDAPEACDKLYPEFVRKTPILSHPVFNTYCNSETQMLRYLYQLQMKDLSLASAMIPLGSCTMKLNATSEMAPITWPNVNSLHPFAPKSQAAGYEKMLTTLKQWLCEITGFAAVSLQPNSGAQGEYAGLLAIQAYHKSRGEAQRHVCLIPTSAHGTNPASAALAGLSIVVVKCDANGNVDLEDLGSKAKEHAKNLSCFMITYPSTHGVFESTIKKCCAIIHENGGQVYLDGANMNAQVGLCRPGDYGADVCHLNLHKTFCIPHGGGGPGMGPIAVAGHLAEFLPAPEGSGSPVASAPFSSASILPIPWMYIRMMGPDGLRLATQMAILNANYMATRLSKHYPILYRGENGRVAHEFIIDLRPFKEHGVTEEDVAKRLMDYSFHGPTMSFPVPGTLMIEPTESEPLSELDRFCEAMISIRQEIEDVISGRVVAEESVLKGAPHTMDVVASDNWNRKYSRETAAYPVKSLRQNKFWPSVARIDNVFGDRNVICQCPPVSSYQ